MKITLYDYLMWIAEDENNITPELIEDNLMLTGMTDKQIMSFYKKHKNDVLEDYKEQYPNGKYMGMNYYDTIVSFYLDGKYYEMNEVNGSFLNDMEIDMEIDSTSTNKIIKIDCDGVLRDMLPAMCDLYNDHYDENLSTEDITDFDVNKIFTKCPNPESFFFEEHSSYVYLNSPKCEKAKEAMDLLHEKGYHIVIVSHQPSLKRRFNTLQWLDENEIYYDSICFTHEKQMVSGDIIVDDYANNLTNCQENEKILIDAPYNRSETRFKRFNNLYEYVETL